MMKQPDNETPKNRFKIGIDAGIGSLAISVIDAENQKIIDTLGYVFPEKEKEQTNTERREDRLLRNQRRNKKRRKPKQLLDAAEGTGLFPLCSQEMLRYRHLYDLPPNARPPLTPKHKIFKAFIQQDPYLIRKKALEGEALTLTEMGRLLWHFAQRRGFPEELRRNIANEEEAKTLTQGNPQENKIGTQQTQESITQAKIQHLGYYLASLQPEKGKPCVSQEKIRNRHTYQYMYVDELEQIWETQRHEPHFKAILTQERRDEIFYVLFSQRPIKVPKRGKCTFEPSKPRAHKASLLFETFRTYKFIHDFRIDHKPLTPQEREKAYAFLLKKEFTIPQLKKALDKGDLESNYDFKEQNKIPSMPVTAQLRTLFGKKVWDSLTQAEREERWHLLFEEKRMLKTQKRTKKTGQDGGGTAPRIEAYAKEQWGWDEKTLEKFDKLTFPQGTTHLSKKAIKYLLPWLQRGYSESDASILGSLKKAFGHTFAPTQESPEKPNYWARFSPEEQEAIEQKCAEILKGTFNPDLPKTTGEVSTSYQTIVAYLKHTYPEKAYATEKIYHPTLIHTERSYTQTLPQPPKDIQQPTVRKFLCHLQKCLNHLIKKHDIHQPEIWVELARDLKRSPKQAEKIRYEQQKNQRENRRIYEALQQKKIDPTPLNIKKYRLWEESRFQCPYTGDYISFEQLFHTQAFDIEHIVPRQRKDSRLINLTLCRKDKNAQKGKRTPFEAFGHNPREWEEITQRAQRLFSYPKYKRFTAEKRPDEPLLERDAHLTGYITKAATQYLRHITPHLRFTRGGLTALLRQQWRLDSLLAPTIAMPAKKSDKAVDLLIEPPPTIAEPSSSHAYPPGRYFIAVKYQEESPNLKAYEVLGYAYLAPKPLVDHSSLSKLTPSIYEVQDNLRELRQQTKDKQPSKAEKEAINKAEKALKELYQEQKRIEKSLEEAEKKYKSELQGLLKAANIPETQYFIFEGHLKTHNDREEPIPPRFIPAATKNRLDQRHHVLDALVIAAARQGDLQKLQTQSGQTDDYLPSHAHLCPLPWDTFKEDVQKNLAQTLIYHHDPKKLLIRKQFSKAAQRYIPNPIPQGELHKDTYYGKHLDPDGKAYYHHRVKLEEIIGGSQRVTFKQAYKKARKIVDTTIRTIVIQAIEATQKLQQAGEGDKIKLNPFFDEKKQREGKRATLLTREPKLFLPCKKSADKIPILRVRLREVSNTMVPVSGRMTSSGAPSINRYVKTGKNYGVGYYQVINKGKAKWTPQVVTFWDAVKAKQKKKAIIPLSDHQGNPLAFTLQQGDLVLLHLSPAEGANPTQLDRSILSQHLYRVQKISAGSIFFLKHTVTHDENKLEQISLAPDPLRKAHPIKIILHPDGTIKHWLPPLIS